MSCRRTVATYGDGKRVRSKVSIKFHFRSTYNFSLKEIEKSISTRVCGAWYEYISISFNFFQVNFILEVRIIFPFDLTRLPLPYVDTVRRQLITGDLNYLHLKEM